MKYISKFVKAFKSKVISLAKVIESHSKSITLVLALLALIVSAYNSYEIKTHGGSSAINSINGKVITAPEKILSEFPKGTTFLGDPKAKLTIVEFGDYQCPFCERFFKESFPEIKKQYIDTGKAKFAYLDLAFLGAESKSAANAAHCASDQGKFWEYHDELYKNQGAENSGAFNDANLEKFAKNTSIQSLENFSKCVESNKYAALVDQEFQLAQKYGANSTPTFLIGKSLSKGFVPAASIAKIIDSQL